MDPKNGLKRKHQSLSIQEKVEMLKKWDLGVSVRELCDIYGIGSSTVYDIKKHRDKILRFYENSDSKVQMSLRKTIKDGKSRKHEVRMMEWFRTRRKDGVDVTGAMIKDEAKALHGELGLKHRCEYSDGWLQRFKKRHGIVLHKNGTNWLVNPEKPDDEWPEEYNDYEENACNDNSDHSYNKTDSDDTAGCMIVDNVETDERTYLRRCSGETSPTETGETPKDLTKKISKLDPSTKIKDDVVNAFSWSSGYTHPDITFTRGRNKHLIKGKSKLKGLKKEDANEKQEDDYNTWTTTYGVGEEVEMVTQGMYNGNNNDTNSYSTTNLKLKSERKIKENNDDVCNNNINYNNNNSNNNINYNNNNNNELVEGEVEESKLSLETLIELLAALIKGLETQSFVTEEELTNFYLMYEKLQRERSKRIQKVHLREMFQKMTRFMYNRQKMRAGDENPVPSTSSTRLRGGASFRSHHETQPEVEKISDQKPELSSSSYPRS